MGAWAVAAFVLAALAVGFAAGVLVGVTFAPTEADWGEMPESEKPEEPWDLRIHPERYLERFPDGPHAERAKRMVT